MRRFLLVGLSILMISLFGACGSDDNNSTSDSTSSCNRDRDCAGGEVCMWDTCLSFCRNSSDCNSGEVCHPEQVCTECSVAEHCRSDETCIDGACAMRAEGDFDSCEETSDCNNGEACLNGVCTPLCSIDEECPESHAFCTDNHICVECRRDEDCGTNGLCVDNACEAGDDFVPIECEDETCNPNEGEYCDTRVGECKKVVCSACDEDSDCRNPAVCVNDPAAGGNGICLINQSDCPGGYELAADDLCHPIALCQDVEYAGVAESCTFDAGPELPPCESGLRCLYNSSVSFCSGPCESNDECMEEFPEGCCGKIGDDEAYCVTKQFSQLCED